MLDEMTAWEYRLAESIGNDPLLAFEVAVERTVPPLVNACMQIGQALVDGFSAMFRQIQEAAQEAEDRERIKGARNVTPVPIVGFLEKEIGSDDFREV